MPGSGRRYGLARGDTAQHVRAWASVPVDVWAPAGPVRTYGGTRRPGDWICGHSAVTSGTELDDIRGYATPPRRRETAGQRHSRTLAGTGRQIPCMHGM